MKQNAITQAISNFFKTTTLHGFKYLVSRYFYDRVAWALCCLASALCAGVLCAVLWQRFLQVPALLQLRRAPDEFTSSIPMVGVCQPTDAVAETFLKHLNTNGMNTTRIPGTLANALQGKNTDEAQVELLEELLTLNNISLLEVLQKYTPECPQLTRNCRWRDKRVDCARLFKKELTRWGVCCVATASRILNTSLPAIYNFDVIKKLDVGLECFQGTNAHGCEFFTRYLAEEWIVLTRLPPGYSYLAQLTFVSEKDNDIDKLVDGTCISSRGYSRSQCLLKCTEKKCGCSDPLRKLDRRVDEEIPPPCPLKRLSCLRTFGLKGNNTCSCLPACQKMITKLILEPGPFKLIESSLDPIYSGLSVTHGVVLRLRININSSKLFILRPTETWLTLLSSLGGVFNMFLGVGLFSALEFLYLIIVKLPIAIRKSTEMVPPTAATFDHVD